jgi:hypothetical protein
MNDGHILMAASALPTTTTTNINTNTFAHVLVTRTLAPPRYATRDSAPVVDTLDFALRAAPGLPRGVTLERLVEGPWPDVQPRAHPHLAVRFEFTEADLAPDARAELDAHRSHRAANADL